MMMNFLDPLFPPALPAAPVTLLLRLLTHDAYTGHQIPVSPSRGQASTGGEGEMSVRVQQSVRVHPVKLDSAETKGYEGGGGA